MVPSERSTQSEGEKEVSLATHFPDSVDIQKAAPAAAAARCPLRQSFELAGYCEHCHLRESVMSS